MSIYLNRKLQYFNKLIILTDEEMCSNPEDVSKTNNKWENSIFSELYMVDWYFLQFVYQNEKKKWGLCVSFVKETNRVIRHYAIRLSISLLSFNESFSN